jgi:hypothetical protein
MVSHSIFYGEEAMPNREVYTCHCDLCQQDVDHPEKRWHQRVNLLLSRMDEQQRRWFVAHESQGIGYGGDRLLSQITGMDQKTIAKGRQELDNDLRQRPTNRTRLPGGGRPVAEKKTRC